MLPHSDRRGQAHIVSLALYAAIIVSGITTVIVVGTPVLEDMRDATAIDSARELLTDMADQVETVAEGGEGSQTQISVQFERGDLVFDEARDEIRYELETGAGLVGPHRSEQVGSLQMSSMATVRVTADTVDGTDCWRLENDYVSTCIRQLPANTSDRVSADTAGYWRFNGGGSTATDSSPHGNDGTLYGDPGRGDGVEAAGLVLDGAGDFVHVPADGTLDVENFTVTGWFRVVPNASGLHTVISKQGDTSLDRNYWVSVDADNTSQGDGVVWARTSSGGSVDTDLTSAEGYADGQWHHVAFVHDLSDDRARLYVDGALADNQSDIDPPGGSGEPVGIGATVEGDPSSTTRHLNGTVDDVRVWNRPLTGDDVRFVYRQQGILDYIDTEHLLVDYRNKEANTRLDADFGVSMETRQDVGYTHNGTGYVEPVETGDFLGRGEVQAHVDSFFGIDYTVTFTMLSGSDFVQVDVDE